MLATFYDDEPTTQAIYSQFNYRPTEKIKIVAGVRFERGMDYKKRSTGRTNYPDDGIGDIEGNSYPIPRFALIYKFNQNHIAKLLYSKATRSGSTIDSELVEFEER